MYAIETGPPSFDKRTRHSRCKSSRVRHTRLVLQHVWLFSAAWRSHRLVHSSSDAKLLFALLVDLWIFVFFCVFFGRAVELFIVEASLSSLDT